MARPKTYANETYVTINNVRVKVPAYSYWRHIIERSSPPYQEKYPTYNGVNVDPLWLDYDNFYNDIITFVGYNKQENGRIYHLDKDLLFKGNKTYTKDRCVLLPNEVNVLLTNSKATRGNLPVGVSLNSGKYMVTLSYYGKNKNLGRYPCPDKAFAIYKEAKEDLIKEVAEKWKNYIDERAYLALNSYVITPDI